MIWQLYSAISMSLKSTVMRTCCPALFSPLQLRSSLKRRLKVLAVSSCHLHLIFFPCRMTHIATNQHISMSACPKSSWEGSWVGHYLVDFAWRNWSYYVFYNHRRTRTCMVMSVLQLTPFSPICYRGPNCTILIPRICPSQSLSLLVHFYLTSMLVADVFLCHVHL